MKHEKYNEILQVIDNLHVELSPLYSEIGELNKAIKEVKSDNDKTNPLSELIIRLTKTARRHNIDKKVTIKDSRRGTQEVVVGINHQGLGYESSYSSQLTPLVPEQKYYDNNAEQNIRDILFNEDAVIELTSIIKKSNQPTFLKTIKILRKYNIVEAFNYFKKGNIEKIAVSLPESDYKVVIDLSRNYRTSFDIVKDDKDVCDIEMSNNDNGKPSPTKEDADDTGYSENTIKEIEGLFILSRNTDDIIKAIQDKTKLLNSVITGYKDEHKELSNLLQPILALEKL